MKKANIRYIETYEKHQNSLFECMPDFDANQYVDDSKARKAVLKSVEIYYQTHTCKETCYAFGIIYSNEIAKLFCTLFPKNLGLGGARRKSQIPDNE